MGKVFLQGQGTEPVEYVDFVNWIVACEAWCFSTTDLDFCAVSRFFVLNNEAGLLEYFVNEQSRHQKPRGTLPLAGAVISPSDEDSHTFTVNAISGEQYKLRGASLSLCALSLLFFYP